jgi:hypothetical protein
MGHGDMRSVRVSLVRMIYGTWRYEECARKFGADGKTVMPKTVGGRIGRS